MNAGRMIVNNKRYNFYGAASQLINISMACLMLVIVGCSEKTTSVDPVDCDNHYSTIASELSDQSLSHEQREHLIMRLSELSSDCPEHVGLKILMADAQVSIGNNVTALAYITSALDIEPSNAEALHVKGSILFMEGEKEEAIALLKKSLELDPTNVEFLTNICSTWETEGNYSAAVESCSKAIQLANEESSPVLYYLRGRAHEGLGNIEDSNSDYRKAKELGFNMWPEQ